jgi:hypothetical protein
MARISSLVSAVSAQSAVKTLAWQFTAACDASNFDYWRAEIRRGLFCREEAKREQTPMTARGHSCPQQRGA